MGNARLKFVGSDLGVAKKDFEKAIRSNIVEAIMMIVQNYMKNLLRLERDYGE